MLSSKISMAPLLSSTNTVRPLVQNASVEIGGEISDLGRDFLSVFSDIISNFKVEIWESHELLSIFNILIFLFAIIGIMVVVYLIVNVLLSSKSQKIQKKRFEETLAMVTRLQSQNSASQAKNENDGKPLLGQYSLSESESEQLIALCGELGTRIDEHTMRPKNSQLVGEIVYKMSMELGFDSAVATLYFCCGMVYDAGFLDIPAELFRREVLSTKERQSLKAHVSCAADHYGFIPPSCLPVFLDAATMHHANINGTGNPAGASGDAIPCIARILRIAESYISLTTKRSYHRMISSASAIKELRQQPGIYDMEYVAVLEKVC